MTLTIENEKIQLRARELASLAGETLGEAVDRAIEERLKRVRDERNRLAERLLEIGRECAPLIQEPFRSMDHGELLYDEKGLPK